ncbi:MAG: hypothetical protein HY658_14020 [Actinobacteria bacterium]|nr:hypothetical protein [Actinomycetota bacterium]
MPRYLLSVHTVEGQGRAPITEEEMQESYRRIGVLEEEMKAKGAWVFSGRLDRPKAAKVARVTNGEVLITDGPFAESKEQLGGFYVIEAADDDSALSWSAKVTEVVGAPIEVRGFSDYRDG